MEASQKKFEALSKAGHGNPPLFDNPLRREFLFIHEVREVFPLYSEKWIRQQMAAGNLPFKTYGRDGILFYVPEVRQAILDNKLAPIKKVQDDKRKKTKKGNSVRSSGPVQGATSLKEFRKLARSQ